MRYSPRCQHTCPKASNTSFCFSLGIPQPVSCTESCNISMPGRLPGMGFTDTVMRPSVVNFTAAWQHRLLQGRQALAEQAQS